MRSVAPSPAWVALSFFACGCSAVLPLGPEFTFGDTDGGTRDGSVRDASPDAPEADGGIDGGCDGVTMEEACADRCGDVVVCGETFTCAGCDGELSCGGTGTPNVCGCAEPPCALFATSHGDANEQRIVGLAVDHEGNVFVAGNFRGTITFGTDVHTNAGATRYDMFLVKLDPTGAVLWSRSFGGPGDATTDTDQQVKAIAVDGAGNVILAGTTYGVVNLGGADLNNDILIAKYGPDGSHVFSAAYGTEFSSSPTALAIDPATYDIVMAGDFWGTLRFGTLSGMTAVGDQAYFDMFLVRFRPDGTPTYSRRYGDGWEQNASSLAVAASHVYMAAAFTGTFDFGAPNTTSLTSSTYYSLALTKLGLGTFHHVWSRQLGTEVGGALLAADPAGNLFVGGSFSGSLEITDPPLSSANAAFLARLGADGVTAWARQYENVGIDALAVGADGSLYVAGQVTGAADLGAGPIPYSGSQDAFIAHFGADGTHLFSRVFSAPVGNQSAVAIGAGPDGEVWAGLSFQGQVDLGLGELRTEGGNDVAIGRFVP